MRSVPSTTGADLAGTCAVAVMAKASAPGLTKTRLVPPLTFAEAAAFNTAFLKDAAETLLRAGRAAPVKPFMAFGPPGSEPFFRSILPAGVGLIGAWEGDFGECLRRTVESLLRAGHGAACVLNADSPTLPVEHLVEAARVLALPGDRAVLGPSTDGGYYLFGLKRSHGRPFEGIAWSTEVVAEQTLARCREIGLPVHLLPPWYDVDDAEGLRRLAADLPDRAEVSDHTTGPREAEATTELLRYMRSTADLADRLAPQVRAPRGDSPSPPSSEHIA